MYRQRNFRFEVEAGLTLMEVIVALGIFGILVVVVSSVYVQESAVRRKLDDQMNEIEIVRRVLSALDCEATKVTNCASSPYIALRSVTSSNPVIVKAFDPINAAGATRMGDFLVRAKCGPDHKISIEIHDSRTPTAPWKNLTEKVPIGCYMP